MDKNKTFTATALIFRWGTLLTALLFAVEAVTLLLRPGLYARTEAVGSIPELASGLVRGSVSAILESSVLLLLLLPALATFSLGASFVRRREWSCAGVSLVLGLLFVWTLLSKYLPL